MLSKRLSAIAKLVSKNSIVADIGSDHGLLPCFLVESKIVDKAYAIDNKKGPLDGAIENIDKYGLKNKVIPVLADGLDNLSADVTSVVIAGIGFMTIKDILEKNIKLVEKLDQVIVSTHTEVALLRKWVMNRSYLITDEVIVKEKDIFYTIISFNPKKLKKYEEDEHYVSEILIKEKNILYFNYLTQKLENLLKINKFKNSEEIYIKIALIKSVLIKK